MDSQKYFKTFVMHHYFISIIEINTFALELYM